MLLRHPFRRCAPPVLGLALLLAACDGGTDAPVPASVVVSPAQATIEQIGGTRQFTARVEEAGGAVIQDAEVTWTSSDQNVATVNGQGVATATGTGTATITARAGSASDGATLTVATAAFACLPADGTPVSLSVGGSMIVTDPGSFCLTLPGTNGQEYLVGIQSIAQGGATMTPVLVQSSTAPGGAPPPAPAATPAAGFAPGPRVAGGAAMALTPLRDGVSSRRRAWRAQHTRWMERDMEYLGSLGSIGALRAAGPQSRVLSPNMSLGDRVTVRVRKPDAQCNLGDFDDVTAELVWKGERAWWFEDVDNPEGFTLADWQALGDRFDDDIDPVATRYFGQPHDLDGNGVIAVLFTKLINERGRDDEGVSTLGFVNPCDFLTRQQLAASNEGEFFYHIAADPSGAFGDTISVETLLPVAAFTIGHEYTHIIQFSRRFKAGSPLMELFMAEGQATLSEEVVGHAVLGNAVGQNYGRDVILGEPDRDWYLNAFVDLFSYYGANFDGPLVQDAPELCTWTASDPPDPCKGRALWYGVTWSLLRWASDHFGHRFADGEAGLHRRLVNNNLTGFDNLANVTGQSVSSLLGHWAPMLYVDDRVQGLDPLLTMKSWNFFSLYTGIRTTPPELAEQLRPHPRVRQTTDWSDSFTVRSPSFEWYLVSTDGRAAALRATTQSRGTLPSHMQMFVVRTR